MAFRMPCIIEAKKILRQFSLITSHRASTALDVRKGFLAVYVGAQEKRRFVVPVSILNHPSFQELLGQAEQEHGFDHPMGGLTIPCREDLFTDLASRLRIPM